MNIENIESESGSSNVLLAIVLLFLMALPINQTPSIHHYDEPNMNYSAIRPCQTAVAPLTEQSANAPIRIFSFGSESVVARANR